MLAIFPETQKSKKKAKFYASTKVVSFLLFFVAGFLFAFLGYDVFAHLFTDFACFAISWLCHYFSYFKLATAAPKNGITWNAYAHYYCCSFFIEMDCIKCREEKKNFSTQFAL